MRPRSVAEVAAAVGGDVRNRRDDRAAAAEGVAIDSRSVRPRDLFAALRGERVDGHAFVAAAFERGAAAALVEKGRADAALPGTLVEVEDSRRALLDLARDERSRTTAAVVGITGSTGKTCTKDFTAAVLRERFRTVASTGSFNNEVGLPLTILAGDAGTEAFVCEMGSRGPGHIRLLCEVARPTVGIVTNVGVAHMELFGSPQVLRDAKAELPEAIPTGGVAVLNADDAVVRSYAARTAARVVTYGTREAQVAAREIDVDRESGRAAFRLELASGETARVRLSVPGEHMVPNALAAAATGWSLGVPVEAIAEALASAPVSAGRMAVAEAPGGFRVLDDSYNANPTSMAAALRAARWMAGNDRCVAVLGHMAELGPIEAEEHARIGELAARLGIDELVVVSRAAEGIAIAAEREGVEPSRVRRVAGADEAIEAVRRLVGPGDLVLVKASRAAGLERVAAALREGAAAALPRSEAPA